MQLDERPGESGRHGTGKRGLASAGWPEEHDRRRRSQPDAVRQLGMCQRSDDPALQELLGRRETLHLFPQADRREVAAVALHDLELLGHHGGSPDVEVESVDPVEPLVRERDLPDLTRLDQSQHAQGAVMDRLLVKFAKQRRADAPVPPTRVQGQGQQMSIATGHTRDGDANKLPGRECHGGRLLFVERLDHVAAAIGGGRGRAGHVDEAHDILHGSQRIPVVHSLYAPSLRHASSLAR